MSSSARPASVRTRPRALRDNARPTATNGEKGTVALDAELVARTRGALGADDTPDAILIERR